MAKVYKFHMYSHENGGESESINEFNNAKIQIRNELGEKVASDLENQFSRNDNIAIANEVSPPGDRGGGGEGPLFPISTWIWVGLSIYILVGKSFLEELGKDLAKRLLSSLFDKNKATEITIGAPPKNYIIIIPPNTPISHMDFLVKQLENLKINGKYIYSPDTKRLIQIN